LKGRKEGKKERKKPVHCTYFLVVSIHMPLLKESDKQPLLYGEKIRSLTVLTYCFERKRVIIIDM
jgi:hypothetical protein